MAKPPDTIITIKTVADTSGADKTAQAHDKVAAAAKRSAAETARSAQTAGQAIERASSAVGKFRAVLTGLGVAGVFTGLIGSIKAVVESFGKAQAEAEKYAKAQKEAAADKEVNALAEAYAKLAKAIGDAASANERQFAILEKSVAAQRELEDAQDRAAEQQELAAVDPNDPAAAEKRAAIQAKYAGRASVRAANRGEQDIQRRAAALESQATGLFEGAAKNRLSANEDQAMIDRLEQEREAALARSVSENGSDATTSFSMFGKNLKDILTLNWGGVGDSRTEAGDAERAAELQRAEKLQRQIDALKKARDAKLQSAAGMEAQGQQKMDEQGVELKRLEAAGLNLRAAGTAATAQTSAANGALGAKQNEIAARERQAAADRALVTAAPGRLDELRARIAGAQGQIAAADENARAQAMDVALAQGQLDRFNMNVGTRRTGVAKERAGLEANVGRETAEAQQASQAAASLRSSLGELIAQLTAEIKALEGEVRSAKSRMNFQASEGGS